MEYKEKINDYLNNFTKNEKILEDIFEGGKRVRPIITYLVFKGFLKKKYQGNKIMNLTIFPEILHNISLILDDLPCMDDDNYRRGKETIHYKYGIHSALILTFYLLEEYLKFIEEEIDLEKVIYIDDKKILLIDYIYNIISTSCNELIEGQYLDLNILPLNLNEEKIIKINTFKTVPLFRISFILGYILISQIDDKYIHKQEIIDELSSIAYSFGLIFQISDDYLDTDKDKKDKVFLNFFLTLGEKRTLEIYNSNLKTCISLLKKNDLYSKHFKDILNLLNKRIYE